MNPYLEEIKRIRTRNNDLWMQIVDVALRVAPAEIKVILRKIKKNDEEVSRLTGKLAE